MKKSYLPLSAGVFFTVCLLAASAAHGFGLTDPVRGKRAVNRVRSGATATRMPKPDDRKPAPAPAGKVVGITRAPSLSAGNGPAPGGGRISTGRRAPGIPPDLVVGDLSLDRNCRVVARIRNNGGPIDDYRRGSGESYLNLKIGNQARGYRLAGLDPIGILRHPGGTLTLNNAEPFFKIAAGHRKVVRLSLDLNNRIAEGNEGNNILARPMTCRGNDPTAAAAASSAPVPVNPATAAQTPLPDLTVTIYYQKTAQGQCKVYYKVRNLGPGAVVAGDTDAIQVSVGSFGARFILRSSEITAPGSAFVWTSASPDHLLLPGESRQFKAVIDSYDHFPEANENNNRTVKQINCPATNF